MSAENNGEIFYKIDRDNKTVTFSENPASGEGITFTLKNPTSNRLTETITTVATAVSVSTSTPSVIDVNQRALQEYQTAKRVTINIAETPVPPSMFVVPEGGEKREQEKKVPVPIDFEYVSEEVNNLYNKAKQTGSSLEELTSLNATIKYEDKLYSFTTLVAEDPAYESAIKNKNGIEKQMKSDPAFKEFFDAGYSVTVTPTLVDLNGRLALVPVFNLTNSDKNLLLVVDDTQRISAWDLPPSIQTGFITDTNQQNLSFLLHDPEANVFATFMEGDQGPSITELQEGKDFSPNLSKKGYALKLVAANLWDSAGISEDRFNRIDQSKPAFFIDATEGKAVAIPGGSLSVVNGEIVELDSNNNIIGYYLPELEIANDWYKVENLEQEKTIIPIQLLVSNELTSLNNIKETEKRVRKIPVAEGYSLADIKPNTVGDISWYEPGRADINMDLSWLPGFFKSNDKETEKVLANLESTAPADRLQLSLIYAAALANKTSVEDMKMKINQGEDITVSLPDGSTWHVNSGVRIILNRTFSEDEITQMNITHTVQQSAERPQISTNDDGSLVISINTFNNDALNLNAYVASGISQIAIFHGGTEVTAEGDVAPLNDVVGNLFFYSQGKEPIEFIFDVGWSSQSIVVGTPLDYSFSSSAQ